MTWKNPFRRITTPDGEMLEGRGPDGPTQFDERELGTAICLTADGETSGMVLMRLPGLWAPAIGTEIQVAEPNRSVYVHHVRFQCDPLGFAAIVYVHEEGPVVDPFVIFAET
jgi:hypothetical protein